jgi:hypothetical protein
MKRLFEVNGEFFGTKMEAKAARGEPTKPAYVEKVNGRDVHYPASYKHQIHKGPDHIGAHGHRCTQSRHRAPQQGFEPKED